MNLNHKKKQPVEVARLQLQQLNKQITERKQYHDQQEKVIADAAESGNLQLRALDYEITESKHTVRALKVDIRNLKNDKALMESDIQQLSGEIMELLAQKDALEHQVGGLVATAVAA